MPAFFAAARIVSWRCAGMNPNLRQPEIVVGGMPVILEAGLTPPKIEMIRSA